MIEAPGSSNGFHDKHVTRLATSYMHWTGKSLGATGPAGEQVDAQMIYRAPFVVLSHDTAQDPIFNYANLIGQRLFEMTWADFMVTPSRYSAEPLARSERLRLFDRVASIGFIDDYRGIRISRTGRRFRIDQATVWTVRDEAGNFAGQAAMFSEWAYV
jgi:hypothetical protein